MQQRHLAILLSAVLAGGLVCLGCGGKKATPAEKGTAKTSATPASAAQPAPAAPPAAAPAPAPAATGLTITKAVYGDLPKGAATDVTDKVKALVKDNTLTVGANNDNFGDPAEGIVKKLRVEYLLNGEKKSVEAEEGQTLTIPAKS